MVREGLRERNQIRKRQGLFQVKFGRRSTSKVPPVKRGYFILMDPAPGTLFNTLFYIPPFTHY